MSVEYYTYPNNDVDAGDWSSSPLNQKIDEVQASGDAPNDATDYITESSAGLSTCTFNVHSNGNEDGLIENLRIYWRGQRGGNAQPDAQSVIMTGNTTGYGQSQELGTSWTTYYDDWTGNIESGKDWTLDELDHIKIGLRGQGGAGTREARVTALWVVVTYKDVSGGRIIVDQYRDDHTNIIHSGAEALDHSPYIETMITGIDNLNFSDLSGFFSANDTTNARHAGYDTYWDYFDGVYDETGNVKSGQQGYEDIFESGWK